MSGTPPISGDFATALLAAVDGVGDRLDRGVESLRAEARDTRRSLVVVILVAYVILGGALGVGLVYGDARVIPVHTPTTVVNDGP